MPLACCALLVACQQARPMGACPAVDSPQGVIFVLPAGGHIEEPVEVRACVERDCVIDDLTSARVSTAWIVTGAAEAAAGRAVSARSVQCIYACLFPRDHRAPLRSQR